jgi:hypothetical protein
LKRKGYQCTPEYELEVPLELQGIYDRKKVVIDIYAQKEKKEIFIEVGFLSQNSRWTGRIELLKKLRPKAKIIHVLQWKNYLTVYDFENEKLLQKARNIALKKGNNGLVVAIDKGYCTEGLWAFIQAKDNLMRYSIEGHQIIEE